jgi:hypothetical protein
MSERIITEKGTHHILVTLTSDELRLAFDIALARQGMNLSRGAKHYIERTQAGLWQHTKGAVGEIAASLYFDRPLLALESLGDYDAPDVFPNIGVRCTGRMGNPINLYDKKDDPQHPFVQAVWDTDRNVIRVTLTGWAFKKDVAREAYWDPTDSNWKVPLAELRPMAELAAIAAEARALESLDRVAKYKQVVAERERGERAARPPSPPIGGLATPVATHAPAVSTPAADRALNEAAATASAPGTATEAGAPPTTDDTSLLERDF